MQNYVVYDTFLERYYRSRYPHWVKKIESATKVSYDEAQKYLSDFYDYLVSNPGVLKIKEIKE